MPPTLYQHIYQYISSIYHLASLRGSVSSDLIFNFKGSITCIQITSKPMKLHIHVITFINISVFSCIQLNLAISNLVISNTPLSRTQTHSPCPCFSVMYYRLSRTPRYLKLFFVFLESLRVQDSGVQLYLGDLVLYLGDLDNFYFYIWVTWQIHQLNRNVDICWLDQNNNIILCSAWLLKLGIVCAIHILRANVFVKDFLQSSEW